MLGLVVFTRVWEICYDKSWHELAAATLLYYLQGMSLAGGRGVQVLRSA